MNTDINADSFNISHSQCKKIDRSLVCHFSYLAIPDLLLASLESFFQRDLSAIRIHTDADLEPFDARALAYGNDIYFARGQYKIKSQSRLGLLIHELTHVLQQRDGRVSSPTNPYIPVVYDEDLEQEADEVARRYLAGYSHSGLIQEIKEPDKRMQCGRYAIQLCRQSSRNKNLKSREEVFRIAPEDAINKANGWRYIERYKIFTSVSGNLYALLDETHPPDENPAIKIRIGNRTIITEDRATITRSVGRYYVTEGGGISRNKPINLLVRREYVSGFGHGARYVIVDGAEFYTDDLSIAFRDGPKLALQFKLDAGMLNNRYVLMDGPSVEASTHIYVYADDHRQISNLTSEKSFTNLVSDYNKAKVDFKILPEVIESLTINPGQHVIKIETDKGIPGTIREDAATVMGIRGVVLAYLLGLETQDRPTQRWDFLHTKARRHGGDSIGTDLANATYNFVLGTEPANSVMTQYEHSITKFSTELQAARKSIQEGMKIVTDTHRDMALPWPHWTIEPVFTGSAQWFKRNSDGRLGVFLHSGYMQYHWKAHNWSELQSSGSLGTICREIRKRVKVQRFLDTGQSEQIYTNRRAIYGRGEDLLLKYWLQRRKTVEQSVNPYYTFRVVNGNLVPAGTRHAPLVHD